VPKADSRSLVVKRAFMAMFRALLKIAHIRRGRKGCLPETPGRPLFVNMPTHRVSLGQPCLHSALGKFPTAPTPDVQKLYCYIKFDPRKI